ncbi:hypothetical protein Moror_12806 [Moniliophthora roreri MCA 2997]|uniref:F-box domain-containing protein n=1 Tax=Moniliophthora roreri (strain MCA 2997) TaxID=1381753 RepID=V2XMH1_MONRO|nr:hypothetical protein Moror_12806 [Moniliophthora roreri MCA 2997]
MTTKLEQNLPLRTSLCSRCDTEFVTRVHHPPIPLDTLQSGELPSQTETQQTLSFIEEEEAELFRYDEEISRLRRITGELEAQRLALHNRIEARRSYLATTRKIPLEIWEYVFTELCCTNSRYALTISPKVECVDAPAYTISRVCSRWRKIAYSRSHLWSSFSIDISNALPSIDTLLLLYIEKSHTQPLVIQLTDSYPLEDRDDNYFLEEDYAKALFGNNGKALFLALLSCMERCTRLDTSDFYRCNMLNHLFNEPPTISLPALHTIEVLAFSWGTPNYPQWFWDPIHTAPLLTKVITPSVWEDFDTLPWAQLTTLDVRELKGTELLVELITTCPNLVSLQIHEFIPEPHGPISTPVTSSLQNLAIGAEHSTPSSFDSIFAALTLRSLTSLELSSAAIWPSPSRDWPCPSLTAMLERSSTSLERLSISFPELGLASEAVTEFLKSTPFLTQLEVNLCGGLSITGRDSTTGLLTALNLSNPDGVLVPKLERLYILQRALRTHPEMMRLIVETAEMRSRQGLEDWGRIEDVVPLKALCVSFSPSRDSVEGLEDYGYGDESLAPVLDRVRTLSRGGTRCVIEY